MVKHGQPAQAYVAQRFDSATATLFGQPTSKHQSELSFVCTRPEQVVTRFELTMRPAVSKGDEPTYAHARCSVSAVYPPYGDRPRQLFRDTIVQTGTELEVVRTRMTLREEFDESRLDLDGEPKREIVRDVDELGRARASGETIYQFALAATYGSALPRRVQEWDA